jgi:hypothetical protein
MTEQMKTILKRNRVKLYHGANGLDQAIEAVRRKSKADALKLVRLAHG